MKGWHLIALLLIASAGLLAFAYYQGYVGDYKSVLVDKIFEKFKNDRHFDANRNVLMKLSVPELKHILSGATY